MQVRWRYVILATFRGHFLTIELEILSQYAQCKAGHGDLIEWTRNDVIGLLLFAAEFQYMTHDIKSSFGVTHLNISYPTLSNFTISHVQPAARTSLTGTKYKLMAAFLCV